MRVRRDGRRRRRLFRLELCAQPIDFAPGLDQLRARAYQLAALEQLAQPADLAEDLRLASGRVPGHHAFQRSGVGMPRSVEKGDALTDLNSVHAMSHPPLGVVKGRELLAIIRQALAETGLKQDAAAAAAQVKESQFSSALNGRGNFGVTWLWAQPDAFLLRFVDLVIAARGLTPAAARTQRAIRIGELVRLLVEDTA